MDDLEMAKILRAEIETLSASLPRLKGTDREQAQRALSFYSDFLLAVATGDQVAMEALRRESKIALAGLPKLGKPN